MKPYFIAPLTTLRTDERGSFAALTAIFLPVALLCAAFAIDLAMLSLERREARAAVDLAAIVAAQNLHAPEQAARSVLAINGHETVTELELGRLPEDERTKAETKSRVSVEPGRYAPDPAKARALRFEPGERPFNAAKVSMRKTGRLYFGAGFFEPPAYEVSAVASAQEIAAFSVGSRLASLKGGIGNALLSALTGSEIDLSVLDYNALLQADVELFSFLDALATDLNITSGRYQDVIASEPTLADIAGALARVSQTEGSGAASRVLVRVAYAVSAAADEIDMTRVIDLGPFAEIALGAEDAIGMPAKVRVMDLLLANALVANGEKFLELDLGADIPGLAVVKAGLSIGEAMQDWPWLRVAHDGETVSNVQLRLQLVTELLGEGALDAVKVRLPLYLELARAEARLADVRCPGGRESAAEIDVLARPGVIDAWIGEADLSAHTNRKTRVEPAQLVSSPAISVRGKARAAIDNISETKLSFTYADIEAGRIKSTSTTDILESLFVSLADNLELDVRALGLGLGGGKLVEPALNETLGAAFAALDEPLAQLLDLLGVRVGEADIRVNGVRCDRSVLVQ